MATSFIRPAVFEYKWRPVGYIIHLINNKWKQKRKSYYFGRKK